MRRQRVTTIRPALQQPAVSGPSLGKRPLALGFVLPPAAATTRGTGRGVIGCRVAYYGPTYIVRDYYDCGLRRPAVRLSLGARRPRRRADSHSDRIVLDVVYNQFW